jgi:hypothetical protein
LFGACSRGPGTGDLAYLPGYWEIRKVVFSDGTEKTYSVNTAIEYFEWDGTRGYRKKVQPTLEGNYLTSDDALPLEVIWREGHLFLRFSGGDTAPWEEEVLQLDSLHLTTRHANGLLYAYGRHEPFSIK